MEKKKPMNVKNKSIITLAVNRIISKLVREKPGKRSSTRLYKLTESTNGTSSGTQTLLWSN